ncbi:uncharacterized protein KY384_001917 [Bacidia gigantensis]|uniref:uncharacterized protein n=1 Tax=Bacidia gigantensis TaxID=2732470 RepID=UPI001D03CCD6|nr:uncharacterized protein KY384_001917 [Bacidia gigantensis]KAG8533134.1 hypothetical protein KY384_001917 [Bacidia gigantensis]
MCPDISTLSIVPDGAIKDTHSAKNDSDSSQSIPAHRSHDPKNNLKRRDPFKFGSRYLEDGDDVFEFNAWDHVTPDDTYYAYAEAQYAAQREHPVSEFDRNRFNIDPEKWWNKFYSNNTTNFFKNRKWLYQEFPILCDLTQKDAGPVRILEVGAGAGNTAFPLLQTNDNQELRIYACDFSKQAVELIRADDAFDAERITAEVWDVAGHDLPPGLEENSVDVVMLIFIFSALSPDQWKQAVENVFRVLKPGGEICFRDYGKGDLTQVRFKKGRLLQENFYIRGDGTRVYFFEEEELRTIWASHLSNESDLEAERLPPENGKTSSSLKGGIIASKSKLEILQLGVDRRMLVNRQKQLKMYRCWLQGRFRKSSSELPPA